MSEFDPPARGGVPTVSGLWVLWGVFASVVAVVTVAIPLLAPEVDTTVPAVLPAALAGAAGVGALVGMVALDRTLLAAPPADDLAAVTELRTRLVLQAAIAEAPVLLAAALTYVLGPPWLVPVAALPALVGLVVVRPSRRRLERFDATWAAGGTDVSLRRALPDA
ncbi:hypothetical protein FTX61_02230 [Nitriliruptoraceae bacterium ZYF776]|nr:hypothetical protein [Profundirhabdus halotolerans]